MEINFNKKKLEKLHLKAVSAEKKKESFS